MLDRAQQRSDDEHGTRTTLMVSRLTRWLGSFPAILLATALIVAWTVGGIWVPQRWGNNTYQLVIGTVTTIVTFVMVFIIQNSQNRDGQALQAKLDAQSEVLFRLAQQLGAADEARQLLDLVGLENAPEGRIRKHHADVRHSARGALPERDRGRSA